MAQDTDRKESRGLGALPEELFNRGREIWLAGLGALSSAEEEGAKLFETLVERGRNMEEEGRRQFRETKDEFAARQQAFARRFEGIARDVAEKTMERLDVPKRADVDALEKRIEALETLVQRLGAEVDEAKEETGDA